MTNKEIRAVMNDGKKLVDRDMILFYVPSSNPSRLAVSVSKKVGNSVVRHRVKRIFKEAFRHVVFDYGFFGASSFDIVVIARAVCIDKKSTDMERSFEYLFKKIQKNLD